MSPNMDIFFSEQLNIAHWIVSVTDRSTSIWVVNLGHSPQLLARENFLAATSPLFYEETLSIITDDVRPTSYSSPPLTSDLVQLANMIASTLDGTQKRQLQRLLSKYHEIFDFASPSSWPISHHETPHWDPFTPRALSSFGKRTSHNANRGWQNFFVRDHTPVLTKTCGLG